MAGIRRLAIFNALLDLIDDDGYQLTESRDRSFFMRMGGGLVGLRGGGGMKKNWS